MSSRSTASGFLLLVVLAALGVVLVTIPPWIAGQIQTISDIGPTWLVYVYIGVVSLGGLLLLGCTGTIVWRLWQRSRSKRERRVARNRNPSELSRDERAGELADNLAAVRDLQDELDTGDELRLELEPLADQIEQKQGARRLEIVAFGAISSGKSSLLNALAGRDYFRTDPKGGTTLQRNEIPWPGADQVLLVDTPGLAEVEGAERGAASAVAAENADLVLLVVDGPLREWEFQLLKQLGQMEKRVLLCLNKVDWYDERERQSLLGQLRSQVGEYIADEDIVAVRAQQTQRPRVRVMADGSEQTELVDVPPDITPLAERMLAIVRRDGTDLLLANLLLQSRGLVEEARRRVQAALDRRAWSLVERYMWGSAGVAALSPFPVIDLAAGCAISTKMVVDLGRLYRQDVDLNTATMLLGQLGKHLLSILGVTMATTALTSAVASLLKTVPGVGTLAGGVLQGIVQALVTRWIGAVFIQYFRNEMQQPEGGLAGLARREWDRLTTITELRKLVRAAQSHLTRREAE